MYVLCPYLAYFCISINVISDQQKIFNYHNLIFCFYDINLSRNSFFLIMFFFPTGFIIFFTIYDLCAVIIIIINLLSIYIIKNQQLTNISHKVVVNAESLLYAIIIVSLIWYIHFFFYFYDLYAQSLELLIK